MKKFTTLRDVGQGRLLYNSKKADSKERLYLATTNEFVICSGTQEFILPSPEDAIAWAIKNKLCSGKEEFLQRCIDVVRVPYGITIPKIRSGDVDSRNAQMDPIERIGELIQHPIYNRCLVTHCSGIEDITLSESQRDEVVNILCAQYEVDYYAGGKVRISDDMYFKFDNGEHHTQMFYVWKRGWTYLECFSVFAGFNLPVDFSDQFDYEDIDETTWLRIPGNQQVSTEEATQLALIATAVSMHYQLNFEDEYRAPDEYPLTLLQELGILPYEASPDLYY